MKTTITSTVRHHGHGHRHHASHLRGAGDEIRKGKRSGRSTNLSMRPW